MSKEFLKKIRFLRMIIITGACVIIVMIGTSYAAQTTKIVNGLNFQVPEDWPIEKRGGIVGPIPMEEYMSIKFEAVEEKFSTIKNDLSDKFQELQSNLQDMETSFSKEIKEIQSYQETQAGTSEELTDILSRLRLLESDLSRLNRKITNKVNAMKTKSEEESAAIRLIEKNIKYFETQIYRIDEEIEYLFEKQGLVY